VVNTNYTTCRKLIDVYSKILNVTNGMMNKV